MSKQSEQIRQVLEKTVKSNKGLLLAAYCKGNEITLYARSSSELPQQKLAGWLTQATESIHKITKSLVKGTALEIMIGTENGCFLILPLKKAGHFLFAAFSEDIQRGITSHIAHKLAAELDTLG